MELEIQQKNPKKNKFLKTKQATNKNLEKLEHYTKYYPNNNTKYHYFHTWTFNLNDPIFNYDEPKILSMTKANLNWKI